MRWHQLDPSPRPPDGIESKRKGRCHMQLWHTQTLQMQIWPKANVTDSSVISDIIIHIIYYTRMYTDTYMICVQTWKRRNPERLQNLRSGNNASGDEFGWNGSGGTLAGNPINSRGANGFTPGPAARWRIFELVERNHARWWFETTCRMISPYSVGQLTHLNEKGTVAVGVGVVLPFVALSHDVMISESFNETQSDRLYGTWQQQCGASERILRLCWIAVSGHDEEMWWGFSFKRFVVPSFAFSCSFFVSFCILCVPIAAKCSQAQTPQGLLA